MGSIVGVLEDRYLSTVKNKLVEVTDGQAGE
jgi:hypothetical protein